MILDAYGRPVKVEPIPNAPPISEWERREREWCSKWLATLAKERRVVFA
jgi:hypothetical protein